jgi:hypothetical protein
VRVEDGHPSPPPAATPPVPASAPIAAATSLTREHGQVTFVPLAVTIGDGFKFGCGFFLAMVLAMLVGFVVLAALFVLTSLFGLNFPLTR